MLANILRHLWQIQGSYLLLYLLRRHIYRAKPLHVLLYGLRFVLCNRICNAFWRIPSHHLEEVLRQEELRFA